MIEVKGFRSAAPDADPSDPLGLRQSSRPEPRLLSYWVVGLIGLALYLKSFLWAPLANAEAETEEQPGADSASSGTKTTRHIRPIPQTDDPAATDATETLPEKPVQGGMPQILGPYETNLFEPTPMVGRALKPPLVPANDSLPPFQPVPTGPGPVSGTAPAATDNGISLPLPDADQTGPDSPPPRNRAPRNTGPVYLGEVGSGAALAIALSHLLSRSTDPDGDSLTITMGTAPIGAVGPVAAGWRYIADTEYLGTVTLTYRISDGDTSILQSATLKVIENWYIGHDGNQLIAGGQGRDLIYGEAGDDDLAGLGGRDLIEGGAGADNIAGGAGNDTLRGGDGDDIVAGGDGHDWISGGEGHDSLYGEAGDDVMHGDDGDDLVDGGAGHDLLFGDAGQDTLVGQGGDDVLTAGAGDDSLSGGDGNDILMGEAGADVVFGEAGQDLVLADDDAADDAYDGGAGVDRLDYSAATKAVQIDMTTGTATGQSIGTDSFTGFEDFTGTSADDVVLAADHTAITPPADRFDAGAGMDRLDYSAATEAVQIDLTMGTVTGHSIGADSFVGFEDFIGTASDDVFTAADTTARFDGGGGGDLYQFRPGDTVQPAATRFMILDFDSDDRIEIASATGSKQIRKAQRTIEDSIEDFFDDFADGIDADEPRLRYAHDWTETYRRTVIEVDFDRDDSIDLLLQLEGEHLLVLDRA